MATLLWKMVGQNQGRFTPGCLGTQKVQFQVTYRVSSTKGITRGTINFQSYCYWRTAVFPEQTWITQGWSLLSTHLLRTNNILLYKCAEIILHACFRTEHPVLDYLVRRHGRLHPLCVLILKTYLSYVCYSSPGGYFKCKYIVVVLNTLM